MDGRVRTGDGERVHEGVLIRLDGPEWAVTGGRMRAYDWGRMRAGSGGWMGTDGVGRADWGGPDLMPFVIKNNPNLFSTERALGGPLLAASRRPSPEEGTRKQADRKGLKLVSGAR